MEARTRKENGMGRGLGILDGVVGKGDDRYGGEWYSESSCGCRKVKGSDFAGARIGNVGHRDSDSSDKR